MPAVNKYECPSVPLRVPLSQEELAFHARVDRSYLSELERDLKSPTVNLLFRLCDELGVSASELLRRIEKHRQKTKRSSIPTQRRQRHS
jgi:transcriptional regulator with XRE-family HTH domain